MNVSRIGLHAGDHAHAGSAGAVRRAGSMRFALGIASGLAAAAIWGGGAVLARHFVTTSLSPADMALLRYAACFPVAAMLVVLFGRGLLLRVSWPRLVVLVLLAGPAYQAVLVAGFHYVPAGLGALLLTALLPVFAAGLGAASSCSPSPPAATGGLAAVLAGLALYGLGCGTTGVSFYGVAIFAVAALGWALLNERVRRWDVGAVPLTVTLAIVSPLFLPMYFLTGPSKAFSAPTLDLMISALYQGWLIALVATGLFFASVQAAGPMLAAVMQALTPVFAAVLGAVVLGESVALIQTAGLMLSLAGVIAMVVLSQRS